MKFAQEQYLQQCYKEYTTAIKQCRHCGPSPEPAKKRWVDAVHSVAAYVNSIAMPKGFPEVHTMNVLGSPIIWSKSWQGGGVFEGDSYDSGVRSWYWRISTGDPANWADTPVDALIAWVTALEKHVEADPAAQALQFIVRMPEFSCQGDDHEWEFLYEGRHGSDKGDMVYRCTICQKIKRV